MKKPEKTFLKTFDRSPIPHSFMSVMEEEVGINILEMFTDIGYTNDKCDLLQALKNVNIVLEWAGYDGGYNVSFQRVEIVPNKNYEKELQEYNKWQEEQLQLKLEHEKLRAQEREKKIKKEISKLKREITKKKKQLNESKI